MPTDTVVDVIALLFTAYGKADDINRQAVYATALANTPPKVLLQACNVLIADNTFLPSIAEIVKAARTITADPNKMPVPWPDAWAEIQKQVHDAFVYRKPVFSRPEIEKAAMRFGWLNLCEAQVEDMPTIHAQVRRIYEDICNRAEEQRKYGLLARSDVAGYIAGEAVQ